MGSLSNLYISQSYQSLLHFATDTSASTTLTNIQDGVGQDLGVAFNTMGMIKSAGLLVSGTVDINTFFSGSTQGYINQSSINNLIRITGSYTASGNEAALSEIGIGWIVNGGALTNGRVIGVSGTPNVDVTYTIDQFYTANGVSYTFTGSIERPVEIEGDANISDDLFVGGHLIIEDGVEITGSIDITGDVTASNAWIQGNLIVSGTLSTYEIIATIVSSSVIFSSGSNILGDATNDTQTLIGSVIMSGSQSLTGSMGVTGDITGGSNLTIAGNISSSTLSGVGNVTLYSASVQSYINNVSSSISGTITTLSQSVDSRLDFLEGPFSTSVDARLDELEAWSSSIQTNFVTTAELTQTASFLQNQINQKLDTASFNSFQTNNYNQYTSSANARLNSLEATTASLIIETTNLELFSASTLTRLNTIETTFATTGSNVFRGNQTITGSLNITGSMGVVGNMIYSGSVRGQVFPITIASNTASMDCSLGNFFTVSLPAGTTHIAATNIQPGETLSLRITNQTSASVVTYNTGSIKFPTGFPYIPTAISGTTDIITFLTFDNTAIYSVAANFFA
jgi:hypothetical protein